MVKVMLVTLMLLSPESLWAQPSPEQQADPEELEAQLDGATGLERRDLLVTLEEHGDRMMIASILNYTATTYRKLEDYDQALAYSNRALAIFEEIGDRRRVTRALRGIGKVHVKRRAFNTALDSLELERQRDTRRALTQPPSKKMTTPARLSLWRRSRWGEAARSGRISAAKIRKT